MGWSAASQLSGICSQTSATLLTCRLSAKTDVTPSYASAGSRSRQRQETNEPA